MAEKTKRILIVAEAVTLAHVARALEVGKQLASQPRTNIIYAFDESLKQLAPTDAEFHPLRCIKSEDFQGKVNNFKYPYTEQELEQYVEDDLALINRIKPDLIIGDFRITLSISCKLTSTPYFSIVNGYWLPEYDMYQFVPRHPILNRLPKTLADFLFRQIGPLAMTQEASPFLRVAQNHNVEFSNNSLQNTYTQSDVRLIVEPEGYLNYKTQPESALHIGPLSWSLHAPQPEWWGQISNTAPIVFISVGSSGSEQMITQVLSALENEKIQIIIAGNEKYHNPTKGIFATRTINNSQVLKMTTVFVSNGGSLSMVGAVANQVPVVGLTINYDQFLNMKIAEAHGLGHAFDVQNLNADLLRQTLLLAIARKQNTIDFLKPTAYNLFKRPIDRNLLWQKICQYT